MERFEIICNSCNRVDRGDGVWVATTELADTKRTIGICPDCCHRQFPQFYSDYEKPAKRPKGFRWILASLTGLRKV